MWRQPSLRQAQGRPAACPASQTRPGFDPYFNLAPTGTSSRKLASTGFPPSSEAATIIPFDSRPRSFRGARFATITTLRPTKVSAHRLRRSPPEPAALPCRCRLQDEGVCRLWDALGNFHHANTQFDLRKVVDGDLAAVGCRRRSGRDGLLWRHARRGSVDSSLPPPPDLVADLPCSASFR